MTKLPGRGRDEFRQYPADGNLQPCDMALGLILIFSTVAQMQPQIIT
jgi:hypothetical protein